MARVARCSKFEERLEVDGQQGTEDVVKSDSRKLADPGAGKRNCVKIVTFTG